MNNKSLEEFSWVLKEVDDCFKKYRALCADLYKKVLKIGSSEENSNEEKSWFLLETERLFQKFSNNHTSSRSNDRARRNL